MAKLVCEICDGSLEVGVGGIATCGDCGMRYTKERIKEMVQESRGAPEVDVAQVSANYREIAVHALESGNHAEAEAYASRLVEMNPRDAQAWLIKGQAAGWQSTLNNLRLLEAANCFARALENAPEGESYEIRFQVSDQIGRIAVAVIKLRANIYVKHPDPDQAKAFGSDLVAIKGAVQSLLDRSEVAVPRLWESIAHAISQSVVQAWRETIFADYRSERYPSEFEFNRFRERVPAAIDLVTMAIGLSANDDAVDVVRYETMILFAEQLRDAKAYRRTVDGYVATSSLTAEAKQINSDRVRAWRQTISTLQREVQRKESADKQAEAQRRLDAYWSTKRGRKEKWALDEEKRGLTRELKVLKAEAAAIPGLDELKNVREELRLLNAELADTGRFKRAERKSLQERIRPLEARRDELTVSVSALQKDLGGRIATAEARLKEIDHELTRPR